MRLMQSPPGAETVIDGRRCLYFVGTGYLGLQGHPEVIRAACEAAQSLGIGSATSRTGFGNTRPTLDVERRCAEHFALGAAFYFASGYLGNHVLVRMLEGTIDAVFVDELAHFCVAEAARLAGCPVVRFRHRDADDLRLRLKSLVRSGHCPLVMTDGVFAARGTTAPVGDYWAVLEEHGTGFLCIDDSHGLAVLGANGRGTLEHAGLFDSTVNGLNVANVGGDIRPRLLLCGTLSKAVGGFGGVIPGSQDFVRGLKATSDYYGGASPPPAPVAAASARALELIAAEPELRTRLRENVVAVKAGLGRLGLPVDDSPVPIVCLEIGDAENMRRIERELFLQGIAVAYMSAYAGLGPEGALRLAVFATHTREMIDRLLEEFGRAL